MNCLSNMCYVCLKKNDKSLININSSLSVNKDIIHIIDYLPCNLAWLKTKRVILICEQCCLRLRDIDQFLKMCLKNSSLLKDCMDNNNTASIADADNEAEPGVDLNNEHIDINEIKCEIKLEDDEIHTVERDPIIEESEYDFVNVHNSLVKEEDTWKKEEVEDKEESPMDKNSSESGDNETDSDSSELTSTQVHTINKEKHTPTKKSHKCLTCIKSFSTKRRLQTHTRIHTGEKPYKCAICEKRFTRKSHLVRHMRRNRINVKNVSLAIQI